jgi:hypothetical protein
MKILPSTTIVVLDNKENTRGEALDIKPVFLKVYTINLSIVLSKSGLLRFCINFRATNNKSCTAYILFESGESYQHLNIYFTPSLGIIP